MDRQAVLLAAHERRPGRKPDLAVVQRVAVRVEPVRPRMQERDAHHGAGLGIGGEAGAAIEELDAAVEERDAGHAQARSERRFELPGGERDDVGCPRAGCAVPVRWLPPRRQPFRSGRTIERSRADGSATRRLASATSLRTWSLRSSTARRERRTGEVTGFTRPQSRPRAAALRVTLGGAAGLSCHERHGSHPARPLRARRTGASTPIAEYGLLADCNSAALVSRARLDRLAVPAALRLRRDLRPRPRPRRRPLVDPAGGRVRRRAALRARHARDRDDVHHGHRPGPACATRWRSPPGQRGHALGYDAPHEVLRAVEGVSGRGRAWSSSWRRGPSTG